MSAAYWVGKKVHDENKEAEGIAAAAELPAILTAVPHAPVALHRYM